MERPLGFVIVYFTTLSGIFNYLIIFKEAVEVSDIQRTVHFDIFL